MIILIGNQKGGAGKSTISLLLANYLTLIRERKTTLLDLDYQQSIAQKAEKAKLLENKALYEVVPADLAQFPSVLSVLIKKPEEITLVDLPGKMDDDGLIPVLLSADLIVCPFAFDEFSVDSTLLFAMVVRKLNEQCPLLFLPNRIKQTVRYETRMEVEKALSHFGTVLPQIPDRIDFSRITTVHTPLTLFPVVKPVLDELYDLYINGKDGA